MAKTGKILLGCGGALVAVAVIVLVGGYFGMNYLEHRLDEAAKPDKDAGAAYGATVDQNGCIDEGVKRSKEFSFANLGKAISLGDFIRGCLVAAKPVKDFCADTPGLSLHDTQWASDQCKKRGIDPEKTACGHVFAAKNLYCEGPH